MTMKKTVKVDHWEPTAHNIYDNYGELETTGSKSVDFVVKAIMFLGSLFFLAVIIFGGYALIITTDLKQEFSNWSIADYFWIGLVVFIFGGGLLLALFDNLKGKSSK